MVLKAEFRISESQANRVMTTAHRRGMCVVAVYTRDVAECKAMNGTEAGRKMVAECKAMNGTEAGRKMGYPLLFTTEPEE
jgi:ATP-dependent Clp protease adaptor protein ClpS